MNTKLKTHGETAGMALQKPTPLPKNQKMTLELYIDLFDSNKQSILTSIQLKQIITMHAFKLIQCVPKDQLVEAVKAIDLMEPARSTLNNDAISSCASITLQEAIKDLSRIKWQECCITSLETLNTVNFDQLDPTAAVTVTSISSSKSKSKRDSSSSSKKEMEPRLGDVDGEIGRELPAGGGKVSESVTCKGRKRKGMSSVML